MTEADVLERRELEQDMVAADARRRHYIVATSHDAAWQYALSHRWPPHRWEFVGRVVQLDTLEGVDVHFVGDWRARPDASALVRAAAEIPSVVLISTDSR